MPAPHFGFDQAENSTAASDPRAGSGMVSLPTTGSAGGNYWSNFYRNGPASVQMPGFQVGNQDQARLQQQQVIQALQAQAAGDPNSMSQQQLQQGYANAGSQQSSLGSTMRGQSAGAARRGIQAGQQGIQRGYAGDQQMLMAQEQQAAQAMLAQLLAQQQGQDINQAQGMAQGQLQGSALDEAMRQFYASQGSRFNVEQGQLQGEHNRAQLGFDLESADVTNRLLQQGARGAGTALSTWQGMDNRSDSQKKIDDAFNGG